MEALKILMKPLDWLRISFRNLINPVIASPEQLSKEEMLARFIFDKDHFRGNIVKAAAFLPARDGTTSVFRKSKMSLQLYQSTYAKIATKRERTIKAVALIGATNILSNNLAVVPEESEFKWHANIQGWPATKDEKKSLAQALARAASIE